MADETVDAGLVTEVEFAAGHAIACMALGAGFNIGEVSTALHGNGEIVDQIDLAQGFLAFLHPLNKSRRSLPRPMRGFHEVCGLLVMTGNTDFGDVRACLERTLYQLCEVSCQ